MQYYEFPKVDCLGIKRIYSPLQTAVREILLGAKRTLGEDSDLSVSITAKRVAGLCAPACVPKFLAKNVEMESKSD